MRRSPRTALLVIATMALAVGCASARPDVTSQQISQAELAIRGAERAGAEELAQGLLSSARQALDAGRRASFRGEGEEARQRVAEATAYAEAAEVRARAELLKRDLARTRQEADELESKLKQIQDRIANPR